MRFLALEASFEIGNIVLLNAHGLSKGITGLVVFLAVQTGGLNEG